LPLVCDEKIAETEEVIKCKRDVCDSSREIGETEDKISLR